VRLHAILVSDARQALREIPQCLKFQGQFP
jgi:hypothetical protein